MSNRTSWGSISKDQSFAAVAAKSCTLTQLSVDDLDAVNIAALTIDAEDITALNINANTINGNTIDTLLSVVVESPLEGKGTIAEPLKWIDGAVSGQVWEWNGTAWALAHNSTSVTVDNATIQGDGLTLHPLKFADGTAINQLWRWTGGAWTADVLSVAAPLTGNGVDTSLSLTSAANGNVMMYNGGWAAGTLSTTAPLTGNGVSSSLTMTIGGANTFLRTTDGTTWTSGVLSVAAPLTGNGVDTPLGFVPGNTGDILQYVTGNWAVVPLPVSSSSTNFTAYVPDDYADVAAALGASKYSICVTASGAMPGTINALNAVYIYIMAGVTLTCAATATLTCSNITIDGPGILDIAGTATAYTFDCSQTRIRCGSVTSNATSGSTLIFLYGDANIQDTTITLNQDLILQTRYNSRIANCAFVGTTPRILTLQSDSNSDVLLFTNNNLVGFTCEVRDLGRVSGQLFVVNNIFGGAVTTIGSHATFAQNRFGGAFTATVTGDMTNCVMTSNKFHKSADFTSTTNITNLVVESNAFLDTLAYSCTLSAQRIRVYMYNNILHNTGTFTITPSITLENSVFIANTFNHTVLFNTSVIYCMINGNTFNNTFAVPALASVSNTVITNNIFVGALTLSSGLVGTSIFTGNRVKTAYTPTSLSTTFLHGTNLLANLSSIGGGTVSGTNLVL